MDIAFDLSEPVAGAAGLDPADAETVRRLVRLWQEKSPRNALRDRYYLSHVRIKDLGVAIPPEIAERLDTRVGWPRKVVQALAARSQFDGYRSDDEGVKAELAEICRRNRLKALYRRNLIGELKHCCGFWEVTGGGADGREPVISAYPATAACALWDPSLKSIAAGLVVVESEREEGTGARRPTVLRLHLPGSVATLSRTRSRGAAWRAEYAEHSMGRPLMEPMPFEPTLERPFGHSRITRTVMSLTDDAIRERARAEVAAECAALPQMWLLGTAQEVISDGNRYKAAMGVINEVTKDEDGDSPTVWQSAQLSMQPHTEHMRSLACQLASETNVPLSELGVVSDNPSSAEAIYAAKEALVIEAQALNEDNGEAMRNVALMALATAHGTSYAEELAGGRAIMAAFGNPARPSIVTQSAAMVQQISAIPWLADTEVALQELGYSEDQILSMRADRRRAQGRAVLNSATGVPVDTTTITTSETRADGAQQAGS